MKITYNYKFGNISKEGYKHFSILYFAYGKNGFLINILGLSLIVKL